MDCINGISYYLNKCLVLSNTSQMIFFSSRKTAHWCIRVVRATQSNCCGALDLLSPEPCLQLPRALITRFRESYSSVITSPESKRLKKSRSDELTSGTALIQHLSKKMRFSCFPVLPGSAVAQTHVIWGGMVKRLFIAYFIGNISAKKYQNAFTYVKVIANQRWDVF